MTPTARRSERRRTRPLHRQRRTQPAQTGPAYLQTKLAASSVLPVPLYVATAGYAHNGRVRTTLPSAILDAGISDGAAFLCTHASTAATISNVLVPSPPPQWPIPGIMNSRTAS